MAKTFVKRTPEEKRQQIKDITDKLDAELKSFVDSDKFKTYLKTMSKFHNYSFNNTILIAMQKPDASLVAGFRAWETNFKRHVKKGEKGIKILAPAPYKKQIEQEVTDPATQKPVLDADGNVKKKTVEVTVPNFQVVTVFDYSSTEGEPLPQIGVNELNGKVDGYKNLIDAIIAVAPVKVEYETIESGAKGYFSPSEQRIALNEGMSELQTLKTLIHETGHSLLHDKDGSKIEGLTDTEKKTRNSKEVEAESIAYTVCEYFGLDTSDYSFGYIAGWVSSMELKELKESMETIRQTSSHIITGIEEQLKVQELERLAADLDQFGYDWDLYEYRDAVEDREANVAMILADLKAGETKEYTGFLKGVLEETEKLETKNTVMGLLDRLDKLPKLEKPPDVKKSIKDRMAAAEIKKAAQGVKEHIEKGSKELVLA